MQGHFLRFEAAEPFVVEALELAGAVEDGEALAEAGEEFGVVAADGEAEAHVGALERGIEGSDVFEVIAVEEGEGGQAGEEDDLAGAGVELVEGFLGAAEVGDAGGGDVFAHVLVAGAAGADDDDFAAGEIAVGAQAGVAVDEERALEREVGSGEGGEGFAGRIEGVDLKDVVLAGDEAVLEILRREERAFEGEAHDLGDGVEEFDGETLGAAGGAGERVWVVIRVRGDDERTCEAIVRRLREGAGPEQGKRAEQQEELEKRAEGVGPHGVGPWGEAGRTETYIGASGPVDKCGAGKSAGG